MKKIFIYAMTALATLSAVSCKDDDVTFNGANDLNRMPMTLFRRAGNTGTAESSDPYVSGPDEVKLNSITLRWFGIQGAAGYEIKYAVGQGGLDSEWENPARMEEFITVGPDVLEYTLDNLEYETTYCFAIRVLSPKGEEYNSNWYGYGTLREWDDVCSLTTLSRYSTPGVINFEEKDYTEFTVLFNLDYSSSGDNEANRFTDNFEVENGEYVAHRIQVAASPTNPDAVVPTQWRDYVLTNDDRKAGKVRITGLSPNSVYVVNLINDNKIFTDERTGKPVTVDAAYNTITVRTKGDPDAPILIPHYCDPNDTIKGAVEYQACRLDTIISNYTADISMAEGQVFYLEGDKAYYFEGNQTLCKGFTMETLPEHLKEGKRAKVYLGGISKEGTSVRSNNFMFGRQKMSGEADAPIQVESIIFRGIDFDCPLAQNYGSGSATGNYFANMYSDGMAVTFDSFECYDCTFQRMVRGFIRVQGSKAKTFKKIIIDGCLFWNQGYYDNNGRGYAWFAGDGNNVLSNVFNDVQVRNCTFYDCPRTAFFTDGDKDLNWASNITYNFTLENNTFINWSTRTSGRNIFQLRYLPGGSSITVKRNLFVLAKADDDQRTLYNQVCDIRNINGSGEFTVDVEDNYSVGCLESHLKDDGIFTSAAMSSSSNSLGTFWQNALVSGNQKDLVVKVGTDALKSTDLFVNPNPPYHAVEAADVNPDYHSGPKDIYNDLKYKQGVDVTTHDIWVKNIGDQRWKSANPKTFYSVQ